MLLTAEFTDAGRLAAGVAALREAGFGPGEIEVFSDRPVELPKGLLDRPSRMSLIAVAAAILNGGLATAFIYYTQYDYPIRTGGMPLFSPWATGVITFELTMAGGVAGTVLALLWEAGLLRRRKSPAPDVPNGTAVVEVRCTERSAAAASECLARSGAAEVRPA